MKFLMVSLNFYIWGTFHVSKVPFVSPYHIHACQAVLYPNPMPRRVETTPLLLPKPFRLLEGSLEISEKLKWMKYPLFGCHDNWQMYKKYLLLISTHFCLKTTSSLKLLKTTDVK